MVAEGEVLDDGAVAVVYGVIALVGFGKGGGC